MGAKSWGPKSPIRVFYTQPWYHYTNWIPNVVIVDDVGKADLMLFLGGEDVDPVIYGQPKHPRTYTNPERDRYEIKYMETAFKQNIPMLGICRGAQFICACASEGMLVQDQPNPGPHLMKTFDGKEFMVSSTHHQAQYPFNMAKEDYKILGWTENMLSRHEDGNGKEMSPAVECEVVAYPTINALGIQPHPEMLDYYSPANEWFRQRLYELLNGELV